jgi:hypothetical protein
MVPILCFIAMQIHVPIFAVTSHFMMEYGPTPGRWWGRRVPRRPPAPRSSTEADPATRRAPPARIVAGRRPTTKGEIRMVKRVFVLAAMLSLAGVAPPADAASVLYTGTFDANFQTSGVPSIISGTFTFIFDESVVPSSGPAQFHLAPDSVAMTRLGSTTFTPADTGVELDYNDGTFVEAIFGGTPNVGVVTPGTDDFSLVYLARLGGTDLANAQAATLSAPAVGDATGVSGTIVATGPVVSEPTAAWLAGIAALAGLGVWACRRRAASRVG